MQFREAAGMRNWEPFDPVENIGDQGRRLKTTARRPAVSSRITDDNCGAGFSRL